MYRPSYSLSFCVCMPCSLLRSDSKALDRQQQTGNKRRKRRFARTHVQLCSHKVIVASSHKVEHMSMFTTVGSLVSGNRFPSPAARAQGRGVVVTDCAEPTEPTISAGSVVTSSSSVRQWLVSQQYLQRMVVSILTPRTPHQSQQDERPL